MIERVVARISKKEVVEYGMPKLKPRFKVKGWSPDSDHLIIVERIDAKRSS